ncbi:response regulator transcription factor [Kitasatospora sp. NPDC089913]|uniref:helix-turn-helix transcriptional regulator n=1 Tax=Kitasatospora sp. NPDC089913 TaxID=3364080 RepID=UPI00380ECD26
MRGAIAAPGCFVGDAAPYTPDGRAAREAVDGPGPHTGHSREQRTRGAVVDGYLRHRRDLATASARAVALSEREHRVLVLLAQGLSNIEIGRHLHLSTGTVKEHVSTVLAKLAVDNRVQAALHAQRAGLLSGDRALCGRRGRHSCG